MTNCSDFNAGAAGNTGFTGFCLHERSLHDASKTNVSGFSLIEVLLVVLVMGILCGTGVSIYAGVTRGSQIQARTDELQSFFYACRQRATMRRTPIRILFHDQTISIEQSGSLQLRIPEIVGFKGLDGMQVNAQGFFFLNGQQISKLQLPLKLAGNHVATVTLDL